MEHAHDVVKGCPDGLTREQKPKWNTHSARRGGAARALETITESGAETTEVEFHFGWDEKTNSKSNAMMWMYAGAGKRSVRRKVTAFF